MATPHDHPARDTFVASILDPAFDTSTLEKRALLDAYAASRDLADLAVVPTVAGQTSVLWKVRPLTATQRGVVNSNRHEGLSDVDALRYAVVARIEGAQVLLLDDGGAWVNGGVVTELRRGDNGLVTDEALAAELEIGGGVWVDELGAVIRHRSNLHPRRFLPFTLPPRVAALL